MISVEKLIDVFTSKQIAENKENCYCDKCKNKNISELLLIHIGKIDSIDRKNKTYNNTTLDRIYCINCFPEELLPFFTRSSIFER